MLIKTGLSSPWIFCNLSFHTSLLPISCCSKRPSSPSCWGFLPQMDSRQAGPWPEQRLSHNLYAKTQPDKMHRTCVEIFPHCLQLVANAIKKTSIRNATANTVSSQEKRPYCIHSIQTPNQEEVEMYNLHDLEVLQFQVFLTQAARLKLGKGFLGG